MGRGTATQGFIRTMCWMVILVLGGVVLVPLTIKVLSVGMATWAWGQVIGKGILLLIGYVLIFWIASTVAGMFHVLPEWERLVLLRLGKFIGIKGPGLFVIPPFIYSIAAIVNMQITTKEVATTATLTKDNVPTKITAALEWEVEDPRKAVIEVKDFRKTIEWVATEALKTTIGRSELRELLSDQDEIAEALKKVIDKEAADYGINVRAVRITDIHTPDSLIEELAVVARAERNVTAKIKQAKGEVEVAKLTREAAEILAQTPDGLQMRYIQALLEISKEESTTIIVYPLLGEMSEKIAAATAGAIGAKGKK